MAKLLTKKTISRILLLRKKGLSINEIKRLVPAGKGTISRYVQGVVVPAPYDEILKAKRGYNTLRKEKDIRKAKAKAKKIVSRVSDKEILLFTAALYWGEGSKREFCFTNTDPLMIKVLVESLQKIFNVLLEDIQVSIRIFEDLDEKVSKSFWADLIGVLPERILSVHILSGKKKGKLKYGMCRIRVKRGGELLKLMSALHQEVANSFISNLPL